MAKIGLITFIRDVRQEMTKVAWPTHKETLLTTAMVFIMILVAALFFLAVDQIIALGLRMFLGVGG